MPSALIRSCPAAAMPVVRPGLEGADVLDGEHDPLRARLAQELVEPRAATVIGWLRSSAVARATSSLIGVDRRRRRAAVIDVQVPRHALRRVQTRIRPGIVRRVDQPEQHEAHRDDRNDHDDREKQPESAAERGLEEGHVRGAAGLGHTSRDGYNASLYGRVPLPADAHIGAIAQLGECLDRTQEVAGSSPASSIARVPSPLEGVRAFLVLEDSVSGVAWISCARAVAPPRPAAPRLPPVPRAAARSTGPARRRAPCGR